MKSPTLFEGVRMTAQESVDLTVKSLLAYGSSHDYWCVAYSGGKDSTTLLTLTVHLIESGKVPRPKKLFVLYGDTRMELPPLSIAAYQIMDQLRKRDWIDPRVVMSPLDERFFVYMLGRGVPPPNNNTFRWCTAQIKVEPMEAELRRVAVECPGKPLMLIGVRLGESAARDARIAIACSRNGAECGQGWYQQDLPDAVCDKLSPLLHWRSCLVWDWLMAGPRAMGMPEKSHGFHTPIIAEAYGEYGDNHADEIDARTGCLGCPLANRDLALDGVLKNPAWSYLSPLKGLRPIYRALREPRNRLRQPPGETRKDGSLTSNQNRMGPLTMEARKWALRSILSIQDNVNAAAGLMHRPIIDIINGEEVRRIEELIAANTWPNKWTGDEPVADLPYEACASDGTRQPLLITNTHPTDGTGKTFHGGNHAPIR